MNKIIYTKVQRWSLTLAMFTYNIVHIKGEDNCWADLLSRRGTPCAHVFQAEQKHLCIAALFRAPVAPDLHLELPGYAWRTLKQFQAKGMKEGVRNLTIEEGKDGIFRKKEQSVWISAEDVH